MTLVCVPIFVEDVDAALRDAAAARDAGADLVEWRIDTFFHGSTGSDAEDGVVVGQLQRLLAESPLPAILTCRPVWEGGEYDGDDSDRVALFEKLCTGDHAPAYLDVELAAYQRSANLRQKINLCVNHPAQQREVRTKLILSTHDFERRPADLDRKLLDAYSHEACAVVKVAYRARSLRDNLDLFELTRGAPKPTIALGMGEFGLMSRVLAPKFGGFLTFASLRDESATAPGQPTLDELLSLYRFRSIGRDTKVYGVIGWPVGHSLSPHVHNAGFEAVEHDGVYLPMPVAADENDAEASYSSFHATIGTLEHADYPMLFAGASVTIPHKQNLVRCFGDMHDYTGLALPIGAANTLKIEWHYDPEVDWCVDGYGIYNTDANAIRDLLTDSIGSVGARTICVIGSGGAARAAAYGCLARGARVLVSNRSVARADALVREFGSHTGEGWENSVRRIDQDELAESRFDAYINCTPVGMTGGPDPDGLSIPVPDMANVTPDTVFFDTVYNPVETPMLRAARERGCRTIDGVEMFVRQAAAQFELWTGTQAPIQLFDRICREKLGAGAE